jgi:hypothetical protein
MELGLLPCVKMRAMENAFVAARRSMTMQIGLHKDSVRVDIDGGGVYTEEKHDHPVYHGMNAIYSRTVVVVNLIES